ncbi:MAG: carbamoyltransferase HypF [Leptothrix sp. (in: Bacteria)]|nr:carbamoyltransferase HypF [Leptothrix sp. (in: b-proteobacteria)]
MADAPGSTLQRRALRVRGTVQGVGFRPFVYRIALEEGLHGWVLNDAEGVLIEAQGGAQALQRFTQRLRSDAPPLARVESLHVEPRAVHDDAAGAGGFEIRASRGSTRRVNTVVPPDTATCNDCLAELFAPADRRHRYAFINCTQCGPRYTLTRALPYDRAMTSMAAFPLCPTCRHEYTAPADRRFHAEPNACPVCGPRLSLVDTQGRALAGDADDAIAATLALLRAGRIVAIKGLGGFHLACDARNAATVALLRERKQREAKPFAVMAANAASARAWVHVGDAEQVLLASAERPIALLRRRDDAVGGQDALPGIAPGLHTLGVMLPCTPIHFLLFHEAAGRPAGTAWLQAPQTLLLVMTSANPGGEPLVKDNAEAMARLHGIAEAVLLHDRDIVARCDDSLLRATSGGATQFIRRARGWVPRPIHLAGVDPRAPSVLATGGWLKNTVCLTRGSEAFVSPHIGSLDNAATCEALLEMSEHLCSVLDVRPAAVAHDLHPDFFSTRHALALAAERGLPCLAVQHHHAHIAAVAAEHGATGPLLGLALDGVGLGSDHGAWGGELLLVDGAAVERLGHLAPLPLPGGDIAAREPWRLAAAALHRLGRGSEIEARFAHRPAAAAVHQMLARELRCPPTTSAGRWFDAAAALLRVAETSAYEGQAAMRLEALAERTIAGLPPAAGAGVFLLGADGTLDPTPLLAQLADEADAARGAALFHQALADGLARWVDRAARRTGLRSVALGGGCFLNALLNTLLVPRLRARGLVVLQAHVVPPNDGGLALGQAWVALRRLQMPQPPTAAAP